MRVNSKFHSKNYDKITEVASQLKVIITKYTVGDIQKVAPLLFLWIMWFCVWIMCKICVTSEALDCLVLTFISTRVRL